MLKLNEELKEKIAYGLIGLILLSALAPLFITMENAAVFTLRALLLAGLAGFYAAIAERKDLFFITLVLFAIQALSPMLFRDLNENYYHLILAVPFLLATISLGVLAYRHSVEFKSFEMLEFLLVVFLLIYASKFFISTEYDLYYAFCLSFLIATLMYNNNIWLRYQETEKNLLIFLLVLAFIDVIQVSARFISF